VPAARSVVEIAQGILAYGVYLNWILIIFNLLPIPPLDGSHVMKYLLPPAWSLQYTHFGARFGFFILIALVVMAPGVLGSLLYPAIFMGNVLLALVNPLLLPGYREWFPR